MENSFKPPSTGDQLPGTQQPVLESQSRGLSYTPQLEQAVVVAHAERLERQSAVGRVATGTAVRELGDA